MKVFGLHHPMKGASSQSGGITMKKITTKRREMLQQILHEMRGKAVKYIEEQIGRELDTGMVRKIDAAMDVGDWAALDLSKGVDHKILEMRYQTYKEIADAFRRLESGTYGICESCGEEVPLGRLKVKPFARYCVPCRTRIEAVEEAEKETGKSYSM
jgi:DnaK suppressor protein